MRGIEVGSWVRCGEPGHEDYDEGTVVRVGARLATVAWRHSVCTTPCPIVDLRLGSEPRVNVGHAWSRTSDA